MAVASKTWSVAEVVLAANKNTYERDNFADLQANKVVIKTGTYTGDGNVTQAITGVGFEPILLWIWEDKASGQGVPMVVTTDSMIDNDADGLAYNINDDATASKMNNDMIRVLGSDGFTVGDQGGAAGFNNLGQDYEFMALGAE